MTREMMFPDKYGQEIYVSSDIKEIQILKNAYIITKSQK